MWLELCVCVPVMGGPEDTPELEWGASLVRKGVNILQAQGTCLGHFTWQVSQRNGSYWAFWKFPVAKPTD